jgi:excisionase family DNA binding protein
MTRTGRALTPSEAAQYLSVKVSTLAKWRHLGVGPPWSAALGKHPRYNTADLDAFLWGAGAVVENTAQASTIRKQRKTQGASAP